MLCILSSVEIKTQFFVLWGMSLWSWICHELWAFLLGVCCLSLYGLICLSIVVSMSSYLYIRIPIYCFYAYPIDFWSHTDVTWYETVRKFCIFEYECCGSLHLRLHFQIWYGLWFGPGHFRASLDTGEALKISQLYYCGVYPWTLKVLHTLWNASFVWKVCQGSVGREHLPRWSKSACRVGLCCKGHDW